MLSSAVFAPGLSMSMSMSQHVAANVLYVIQFWVILQPSIIIVVKRYNRIILIPNHKQLSDN